MKTKWSIVSLLLVIALALTACASSNTPAGGGSGTTPSSTPSGQGAVQEGKNETPAAPKILNVAFVNPPSGNNTLNTVNAASLELYRFIHETLFAPDSSYTFQPRLAKSVETDDFVTFTYKLNENIQWSDGTPFTTEDIKFTLDIVANPELLETAAYTFDFIAGLNEIGKLPEGASEISGLNIIDADTFSLTVKQAVGLDYLHDAFSARLRFLPKHILKDVPIGELSTHEYLQTPKVSLGAFVIENYVADQYVETVANEHYFLGRPKLDKLIIKILPASDIAAQLSTGEIDLNYTPVSFVPVEDIETIKSLEHVETKQGAALSVQIIGFNINTLSDQRVRQAIVQAIDRQLLVDQLLLGDGKVVDTFLSDGRPYHNDKIAPYAYDPEASKQLLAEAGWDSSRTIRIILPVGNKIRERAADIIADSLGQVGIKVQLEKVDFGTLGDKFAKRDFDAYILAPPTVLDPSVTFQRIKPGHFQNYSDYTGLDDLVDQGKYEVDSAKRAVIFDEVQQRLHDDIPVAALFSQAYLQVKSKRVLGAWPYEEGSTFNLHEWDIAQ